MEQRIKSYEKYIEEAAKHPTKDLLIYHQEMVKNFQHERAIHLAVTLFFVAFAAILIVAALCSVAFIGGLASIGMLALAGIVTIISGFYIKHYYFLENHVQKLYDVTEKIYSSLLKH